MPSSIQSDLPIVNGHTFERWPRTKQQADLCYNRVMLGMGVEKAAVKAGYSGNTAKKKAWQILNDHRQYCRHLQELKNGKLDEQFEITEERVLQEAALLAFTRRMDTQGQMIQLAALNFLAKCRGMFEKEVVLDRIRSKQARAGLDYSQLPTELLQGILDAHETANAFLDAECNS